MYECRFSIFIAHFFEFPFIHLLLIKFFNDTLLLILRRPKQVSHTSLSLYLSNQKSNIFSKTFNGILKETPMGGLSKGIRIFVKSFIKLSRFIYKENDIRALLKKEINNKYNSNLIEEKSYIN